MLYFHLQEVFPKRPNRMVDTLGSFLKYDRQVLRFYGYWDDTENLHGIIHDLELHYYLSDNTMEIKENVPSNAGRDSGPMFVKRMKIPKVRHVDKYNIITNFNAKTSNIYY